MNKIGFATLKLAALLSGAALTLALTACSSSVALEPAADSNNPRCADQTVRLPEVVAEQSRRPTNAQATGAWGTPAAVILRCGLPVAEVSELPCITAGGVDWLVDQSQAPSYRFITYKRDPATEVIVDSTKVSGATALDELAAAIQAIPASGACLG